MQLQHSQWRIKRQNYLQYNFQMEGKVRYYPNRIEVSQFGAAFLKQLPYEIEETDNMINDEKQNVNVSRECLRKRGEGIDFRQYANRTFSMVHKELNTISKSNIPKPSTTQSKRKLLLHHDSWVNQQKLLKHKMADTQSRMEQTKYSEYDWRGQSQTLKNKKKDILESWEQTYYNRNLRIKCKLRRMLDKKYYDRAKKQENFEKMDQRRRL